MLLLGAFHIVARLLAFVRRSNSQNDLLVEARYKVAREANEEQARQRHVPSREFAAHACRIAGVPDAGIVGAKAVEIAQRCLNGPMRPVLDLLAQVPERTWLPTGRNGQPLDILACVADARFEVGRVLRSGVAVERFLEICE